MSRITFIVGGARSGKSRYAEGLAAKHRGAKTYIATAEVIDDEMRERIAAHREQRGNGWETVEVPLELCKELRDSRAGFILVDCITVWMGNLLHQWQGCEIRNCRAVPSAAAIECAGCGGFQRSRVGHRSGQCIGKGLSRRAGLGQSAHRGDGGRSDPGRGGLADGAQKITAQISAKANSRAIARP